MATGDQANIRTRSRYLELVERAMFELKQAIDCARALGLPESRRQRLVRVRFELSKEVEELKTKEATNDGG